MLIVEEEPPKTVSGSKPLTKAIERPTTLLIVKLEVRAFVGARFSLFVIFVGGMVLVYRPGVVPVT